jgi:hypothetical protein
LYNPFSILFWRFRTLAVAKDLREKSAHDGEETRVWGENRNPEKIGAIPILLEVIARFG